MSVGDNIKRLRLEKGLTQKQLGKKCKMADSAIRRYENNGANPKIQTIEKIASALGVPISDLLGEPLSKLSDDMISLFGSSDTLDCFEDTSNLSPEEEQLLSSFNRLNSHGKQKVIEYSNDLEKINIYTKS